MRLFNALIVPIALYGHEARTHKKSEEKLLVFEMAALRKILGIHIMDKMRNENIRMALNLSDTIVQKYMRDSTNGSVMYSVWMKTEMQILYCTAEWKEHPKEDAQEQRG